MALRVSRATGNWSTAATWGLADSATIKRGSLSAISLTPTTGNQSGVSRLATGVAPAAITAEFVAIRLESIQNASGTMTVQLVNTAGNSVIAGTTVTVNVADLPAPVSGDNSGGWLLFKFASPVALTAVATAVDVFTSVSGAVTIWQSTATAADWDCIIVGNTQAVPAAADEIVIAGNYTGAGTSNTIIVTMDNNTTTAFGAQPVVASALALPAVDVCSNGRLIYSITANTTLRLNGCLIVHRNGLFQMGNSINPVPTNFTAVLEFGNAATAANGDYGLVIRDGGNWYSCGSPRTAGKLVVSTLLTADVAASGVAPSTSALSVADDTGWLSGDAIALAPTARTISQGEVATLTANASASAMTIANCTIGSNAMAYPPTSNRGLLSARSGTAPMQAEVILLTRNVKVRCSSITGLSAYVKMGQAPSPVTTLIANVRWTEFYYMGVNSADKRGIDIDTGAGCTVQFVYCSVHDTPYNGVTMGSLAAATQQDLLLQNCMFWNCGTQSGQFIQIINAQANAHAWTFDTLIIIGGNSGSNALVLGSCRGTVKNCRIAGCSTGISFSESSAWWAGQHTGNIIHSCTTGFTMAGGSGSLGAITVWRCTNGFFLNFTPNDFTFDDFSTWGCGAAAGVAASSGTNTRFRRLKSVSDASFPNTAGLSLPGGTLAVMAFEDCDFTVVTGGRAVPTTSDVIGGINQTGQYDFRNCLFNTTAFSTVNQMSETGRITSHRHNRVDGDHRCYTRNGLAQTDTAIFKTAAPSERLTPQQTGNNNLVVVALTAGSPNATIISGSAAIFVGRIMNHVNLPAGTRIVSYTPSTRTIVMSNNAITTGASVSVMICGYLKSGVKQVAVAAGASATINVWVRKSAATDTGGVAYSTLASAPRLMQKANSLLSTTTDAVLATAAAAVGTWEQLTATVTNTATDPMILEFYVDCSCHNGTNGYWINVDDWSVA